MSFVTRCPRCSTLFRVTPAQLQLRAGKVRCGRCMHVFDGLQALAVEQGRAAELARMESADGGANLDAPAVAASESSTMPAAVRDTAAPVVEQRAAPTAPTLAPAPEGEPPARSWRLSRPTPAQGWAVGCLVLLVFLGLQLAFVYRSELAARYPVMKTSFGALCDVAGCVVTLPQRPHLVKIEASDVHMIDVGRPGFIQLTATLRSYANYDLAYPALDLVLTNANEHALARRVFVPDEYLDATRDPKRGLSPNAEITVALDLDTTDLKASGFRLDLLPAPAP